MSDAQNSFVNHAEDADISSQYRRSEIIFKKSFFGRDTKLIKEVLLRALNTVQMGRSCMEDATIVSFDYTPNMCFELPD